MPHLTELFLAMKMQYARSFVTLFEETLDQHIESIRTAKLSRLQRTFWMNEARRTFRYAFFLRYYALFESHLLIICERIKEKNNLPLALNDIRGESFLWTFDKFMTRVALLPSPSSSKHWKEILAYSQIRNLLIHADGTIKDIKSHTHLKSLVETSHDIHIDKHNRICFRKRFAIRVLSNMSNFLLLRTFK